jgi:hypothetical protein
MFQTLVEQLITPTTKTLNRCSSSHNRNSHNGTQHKLPVKPGVKELIAQPIK